MAEAKPKRVKLLSPVGRLCFPAIFNKARLFEGATTEPKFELTLVFDKAYLKSHPDELARFNAMRQAADKACVEKFKKPLKEAVTKIANFRDPFRDGEEKEHLGGFGPGTIYIKAKSKNRPGVVAADAKTPIDDPSLLYAGCYVRVSLGVWAYDNVSKGVSFWINSVMFVRDGVRLDGQTNPEEDFDGMAETASVGAGDDDDLI